MVAATKSFKLSCGSCEIKKNGQLKKIVEKPSRTYLINVGLYLFKPEVINLVKKKIKVTPLLLISQLKQ